jgi:AraC family transcriptional regulator
VRKCPGHATYYLIVTSTPALTLPTVAVDGAGVVRVADYGPGSSYGPRELIDFEFLWLLKGSAVWTVHTGGPIAGSRVTAPVLLLPGTLLLAPTGAVDSFHWDPATPSRHAWAHFRVADPADLPDPRTWPLTRDMASAPVLAAVCRYLEELGGQLSSAARQRSDQLLGLLLDLFVRGPLDEPADTLPELVAAAATAAARCWAADGVRLVEVHELAAATNVSDGHLYRVFREHYGVGPARVLELVRLSRAGVMLQRSNASLTEVAAACGFANAYHLSRRFRLTYAMPPGAYRRDAAGTDPTAPLRAAGLLPVAHLLGQED